MAIGYLEPGWPSLPTPIGTSSGLWPPVGLAVDEAEEGDVLEGHLPHDVLPHHDHPRHPKEQDVGPREEKPIRVNMCNCIQRKYGPLVQDDTGCIWRLSSWSYFA
jgi:hypothetical protein